MTPKKDFPLRLKTIFNPLIGYLKLLFDPTTPVKVRLLLAAGIIYLVSPWDLLPDWVLGIGIIDDLAVLGLISWLAGRMATTKEPKNKA